jgi:diguanylate cyclase (GGDEF)-like protein
MPKLNLPLSSDESDPELLRKLAPVKHYCCVAVALIGILTLLGWYLPELGKFLPNGWRLMTAETALGVLLSAFSLELSENRYSLRVKRLSQLLAVLAALLGMVILGEYALHIAFGLERLFPFDPNSTSLWPDRPSPQTATALVMLGTTIVLIRVRGRIVVRIADLVAICLGLLVLVLASGEIFGALQIFGLSGVTRTSPQTLLCFVLLTLVAFLRRAELGIFSIFLGRGIGSRIARVLGPVILVLPFLREIARQRMVRSHILPEHYATAILASAAAAMSFLFLMLLVFYIKSMENEIHKLTVRDELTGLYNLRGFRLLGEQAVMMAQRVHAPFSVLFIDVDNLKQINDEHGHNCGSATLKEAGNLLRTTFRETDVLARIGGDEFAVAGQFSRAAISVATQRLREASTLRNAQPGQPFALTFSVGYVTAEPGAPELLDALLSKADKAMYEEKRRKKTVP